LRKLINGTQRLRDGDYSARIALDLTNEFTQLQDTFNSMAEQIEKEIALRRQSEETRKKLILDISHDLKNPLASILGYAELCRTSKELTSQEQDAYLKIIYENSLRTNSLITGLFDLAKIESPEFILHKTRVDVCEYLREEMGKFIAAFDVAGFGYGFDIPEEEIFALLDTEQMDRVFQNLAENAVRYNPKGTKISVGLKKQDKDIVIFFQDNGAGIPEEAAKDVFKPFVRADKARNSQTGGTGLGLAIVSIIVLAHGGTIDLKTDSGLGCAFSIRIPWI
jgi:signal transduction histidine kinase